MNTLPTVELINPNTLRKWIEKEDVIIIDVRERNEFDLAHIEGAILLPLSSFNPYEIPNIHSKKLVIHCASGVRCGAATQQLINYGFKGKIHRLAGGIDAWYRAGGSLKTS